MANWVLYQWGPIQFQVFPFNVNTFSHNTATDWAKKEIAGAAMYREWVGENDELITLKGLIFPHYFARMYFLVAAAVLILIALVIKYWMNVNPEEGFLGKGLMIIIAVLVIVGILSIFGLLPFRW